MAFLNRGPQPEIIINQNGVRYIDPNPTDEIVNHEDLVMYVKLVARTKGRSIITSDGRTTEIEAELKNVNKEGETNFTYNTGDNYIDTKWTNIGGGVTDIGEDKGSLGITNINIEFKSSFMPQITIDFIDIRGATLFEQGPCSPYSLFFHLPYPVFELTVKGYYGKPVTYTLALTKFNTKFNADTGNFESKAEFVGYTYAFLADIPIGYVMASYYMDQAPYNAKDVLQGKWDALKSAHPELTQGVNALPEEALSMFDLVRRTKKLETQLPVLKNTTEVIQTAKLSKARNAIESLKSKVIEYQREFLTAIGGNKSKSGIRVTDGRKNTLYILVPKDTDDGFSDGGLLIQRASKVNQKYLADLDDDNFKSKEIGLAIIEAISNLDEAGVSSAQLSGINFSSIKGDMSFFYSTAAVSNTAYPDDDDWFINIYPNLLKPIEETAKAVNDEYKKTRDKTQEQLNDKVRDILGFWPSVRNVFAIILTNTELFLKLLIDISVEAEQYHENESFDTAVDGTNLGLLELLNNAAGAQLSDEQQNLQQNNKVYPWPTYWAKQVAGDGDESDPGQKEEYPGENENFVAWPEVRFVEAFIKALTELRQDLQDLEESAVDNLPGFDDYVPITSYETGAFGEDKAPSRWYRIEDGISGLDELMSSIALIVGENAFLFGDYSTINSLTVWKSQIGFKNGWGFETLTNGQGTTNGYTNAVDKLTVGPQRLANNPVADTNADQLNRFPRSPVGKGFDFPSSTMPNDRHNWTRHISPVTKVKMEAWGKVDALNFLSIASSTNQKTAIRTLKTYAESNDANAFKKFIIEALTEKHKEDFAQQKFDEWKVSATAEINGSTALIDKQSNIWSGYYSYVKSNPVLSLKGPIKLSHTSEVTETLIHANPNLNPFEGARLAEEAQLGDRNIEIDEKRVSSTLFNGYKKIYGIKGNQTTTSTTPEDRKENETGNTDTEGEVATKDSIAGKSLLGIPKVIRDPKGSTPYFGGSTGKDEYVFNIDKKTNMLTYDWQKSFYGLWFFNYEDFGSDGQKTNSRIINDLGASRYIFTDNAGSDNKTTIAEWANFVGKGSETDTSFAAGDAFVQTPLWTLNYPRYKNPYYGNSEQIDNVESVYRHDNANSEAGKPTSIPREAFSNTPLNETRNWGTWWGLNQYYIRRGDLGDTEKTYTTDAITSRKYVLPLAYLAVMSFGLDNPQGNQRSGHFPPYDGEWFHDVSSLGAQLSSFSNFTHTHVTAEPTKSWLLMIGAMLWRMKEGKMLLWKTGSDGIGIEPDNIALNKFKGWNADNLAIGTDDLSDPVWWFHNELSAPWWLGGSVFSDPRATVGSNGTVPASDWDYASPYYGHSYLFNGQYVGLDKSYTHRWTSSYTFTKTDGASVPPYLRNPTPSRQKYGWLIGPQPATVDWANYIITDLVSGGRPAYSLNFKKWSGGDSSKDGWTKSHFLSNCNGCEKSNGSAKIRTSKHNIIKGLFDQCRQDQMPFIINSYNKWNPADWGSVTLGHPKTLVITAFNNAENGTGRETYRAWEFNRDAAGNLVNGGLPTQLAKVVKGAPNRVRNAYPVLKESVKELMFLPKSLMESFIAYFENWATNECFTGINVGSNSAGWLNILDPLNWAVSTNGIELRKDGQDNFDYKGYKGDISIADDLFEPSGFTGWLSKKHLQYVIKGVQSGNVKGYSGFFPGDAKQYNLWYQAYGVDGEDANGYHPRAATNKTKSKEQPPPPRSSAGQNWERSGNSCFIPGSKVMLLNNKTKNIEDINVGDTILGYDIETKAFIDAKVKNLIPRYWDVSLIKIYLENGKTITCTEEHPFWVKGKGWSSYLGTGKYTEHFGEIKPLVNGDEFIYYENNNIGNIKINKIVVLKPDTKLVYDLVTEGNTTYFVGNVVTSNYLKDIDFR